VFVRRAVLAPLLFAVLGLRGATSWPVAALVTQAESQPDSCRFVLGFEALRELIGPATVGDCLEDEYFNLENGNAEQHTTKGLLVWRKVDNFTAFTDGATSWINGPEGVQSRPNNERFAWEKDPLPPAAGSLPTSQSPPPPPATPAPRSTPAATATRAAEPPSQARPAETAPQTLSGRGRQVTEPFTLEKGLVVVRGNQTGRSNFSAKLVDAAGNEIGLVANVIGDVSGARYARVASDGSYRLNVTADGSWKLVIEQPKPLNAPAIPKTFTGKNDDVTEFVRLPEGLVTARSELKSGKSNFVVRAVSPDGQDIELLANEIGVSSASKAFNGRGRIIVIAVQADGDWTVTLE